MTRAARLGHSPRLQLKRPRPNPSRFLLLLLQEVVFFSDKYHDTEMMAASRRMFKLAGIRTWQHKPAISNVLVDFEGIR
eukprot:scaffold282588_cov28-Tisochrysis_lutea.AAC.4